MGYPSLTGQFADRFSRKQQIIYNDRWGTTLL